VWLFCRRRQKSHTRRRARQADHTPHREEILCVYAIYFSVGQAARRGTDVALHRSGKLIEVSGEAATFNRLTEIFSGGQLMKKGILAAVMALALAGGSVFAATTQNKNAGGSKPAASTGMKKTTKKHRKARKHKAAKKAANKNM
jgi:hypothetical protein